MTITQIKNRTSDTSPYFFNKKTLNFFGQTMGSFKVRKLNSKEYLIFAPIKIEGRIIGETKRIFNIDTNQLTIKN